MSLLLASLLLAANSGLSGQQVLQEQVDKIVQSCRAANYLQLRALTAKQVNVEFKAPPPETGPAEERASGCVLAKMKRLKDVDFGMLGNEVVPSEGRK